MDSTFSPEPEASEPSYIDHTLFLSPTFSAPSYANTLVLSTNNSSDTPLDLSTPLSKVLFDIQEVDSHIHTLTSSSALPLLNHTRERTAASSQIVDDLGANLRTVTASYERLEQEVTQKHASASEIHTVSSRLWHTLRLGRSVSRALQLGRTLEVQMSEAGQASRASSQGSDGKEGHRATVRAATTVVALKALVGDNGPGGEGEDLHRVNAVTALQKEILNPGERSLISRAMQVVKDFALSTLAGGGAGTYAQASDVRLRTLSAMCTLYLLSPDHPQGKKTAWEPENLVAAVTEYIRNALSSSATAIGRALNNLSSLERALLDVSARCQNIVALEQLLAKTPVPEFPTASSTDEQLSSPGDVPTGPAPKQQTLLPPILAALETSNLASFFWRSLAGALAPRIQEFVNKGGPGARALKQHRGEVKDLVTRSVQVGCEGVEQQARKGDWGREVAVMVGAVVGSLGR